VLPNPNQQEAGFSQGQFEIEYNKVITGSSIYIPPSAIKGNYKL